MDFFEHDLVQRLEGKMARGQNNSVAPLPSCPLASLPFTPNDGLDYFQSQIGLRFYRQ